MSRRTSVASPTLFQFVVHFLYFSILYSSLASFNVLAAPTSDVGTAVSSIDSSTQPSSNEPSQGIPTQSTQSDSSTSSNTFSSSIASTSSHGVSTASASNSQSHAPSSSVPSATFTPSTTSQQVSVTSTSTQATHSSAGIVDFGLSSVTSSLTTSETTTSFSTSRSSILSALKSTSSAPRTLVVSPTSNDPIQDPPTYTALDPAQTADPSAASSPSGFLNNKAAVASTFTILGLIAAAGSAFLIMYILRRRRRHRELEDDSHSYDGGERTRKRVTYASSFGINDKHGAGDVSYESDPANLNFQQVHEEDVENTLAHHQIQAVPFDPYFNNYALPDNSIIPEPYHDSVLDHYSAPSPVQTPYEQAYPSNYGSTLYSTPHPGEFNLYGTIDAPTQQIYSTGSRSDYNRLNRQTSLRHEIPAEVNRQQWGTAH